MVKNSFAASGIWLERNWSPVLAAFVAIIASYIAIAYAAQPLLEVMPWRQTQTALTAYWMIHDGWKLAYETPVLGYPWSIPEEFPIYQALAALISWAGGFPLDNTGRLLSFFFLIACAWPAFKISRRLELSPETAWIFCAFLWSSPLYLFWSRTFLIETTALFFTLAAIPYALDLRNPRPAWSAIALFALFATLGMLQKVTTAGPAFLVIGLVVLTTHIRRSSVSVLLSPGLIVRLACAFGVPLLTGLLWLNYTDVIKSRSIFTAALTSEKIPNWIFGTWAQRLSAGLWKTIFWDRMICQNGAGIVGLLLLAGALIWSGHRIRIILLACLILAVLPVLIFVNLHAVHEYYQMSCIVFMTGALAVAIAMWLPQLGWRPLGPLAALAIVFWNFGVFAHKYPQYLKQDINVSNSEAMAVGGVIRRYTPPGSAIAIFGQDWNSVIPYYAQRKALSPAESRDPAAYHAAWAEPERYLGGLALGAIVFCPSRDVIRGDIREQPDVRRHPVLFKVRDCYINLPGIKSIVTDNGTHTVYPGLSYDPLLDKPRKRYQQMTKGVCPGFVIDQVNGVTLLPDLPNKDLLVDNTALSPGARLNMQGLLFIDGLLINDARTPEDMYLTLRSPAGSIRYVHLTPGSRSNVSVRGGVMGFPIRSFNEDFRAVVDVKDPKGAYTLGLALGQKDTLKFCSDVKVPIRIGTSK